MGKTCALFQVHMGWSALVGDEKGIQRIYLPVAEKEELQGRLGEEFPGCPVGGSFLEEAKRELEEYFSGRRQRFDFPLDLSAATPFQRKVYRIMREIPYGKVRTYAWLAREIGNPGALRAVGGANGKNRWPPVIPCHRIVGSDGRLTGFSSPGGLALKARLLELEGIAVEEGRVRGFSSSSLPLRDRGPFPSGHRLRPAR